jgi:hypothetical protein
MYLNKDFYGLIMVEGDSRAHVHEFESWVADKGYCDSDGRNVLIGERGIDSIRQSPQKSKIGITSTVSLNDIIM